MGQVVAYGESHSGPLPPPQQLAFYREQCPEAYEAIVGDFRATSQVRNDATRMIARAESFGIVAASLVLPLLFVIGGVLTLSLALLGQDIGAICSGVVTIVMTFWFVRGGQSSRNQDPGGED